MNPSTELINRLWKLCAVLRKDGITYQQYVTELTYLLFLKMMHEMGRDLSSVPPGSRWADLVAVPAESKLKTYKEALARLGSPTGGAAPSVRAIFAQAATSIRDDKSLTSLVDQIDQIGWFSETEDSFGDLYEGLLQKNAEETKRGAGQYFTPRSLINIIVELMQPGADEVVQDPAAGTGGFLISAARHAREASASCRITGMENVRDTYRLLLMNLHLHEIDSGGVELGDTLSPDYKKLPPADLILTNPPFGSAGGRPSRDDLSITPAVSTYALPFVEHCIHALKIGGRAAVVVPDNVLHEDGRGRALRTFLMDRCNLHTMLRLPTGIFYAQGVKTNVLFFERENGATDSTPEVWVYDLRTDMPTFGKNMPIEERHFESFVEFYGPTPTGSGHLDRTKSEDPRARRFTREEIAGRNDDLDLMWLREDDPTRDDALTDPDDIIAAVVGHLDAALAEVRALADDLDLSQTARRRSAVREANV